MVDHPRLPFGARRLAVHAGTGGSARCEAGGEVGVSAPVARVKRSAIRGQVLGPLGIDRPRISLTPRSGI